MSSQTRAQIRVLSSLAFGQSHRLELILAIGESPSGLVNQTDLASFLGLSNASNIQKPIANLRALGLIELLTDNDSKKKHYVRLESLVWSWARELAGLDDGESIALLAKDDKELV